MTEEEGRGFYFSRHITMNRPLGEKSSSKIGLSYVCLLILLVLLFYWEGLGAYFNHEDPIDLIVSSGGWVFWGGGEIWRPLTYSLQHLLIIFFGIDPFPHRLIGLIMYICILLLLYHFYNLLLDNKTLSKLAVLLFTSFYLNPNSVIEIAFFRERLFVLFLLSTLICFVHYRKTNQRKYYVLAIISAFLAQQSKESAIGLPLFLLAIDYYVSQGVFPPRVPSLRGLLRSLPPYLPFLILALGTFLLITSGGAISPVHFVPGQAISISKYFWNTYWFLIYSFAPCFFTDRVTVILALSIMVGLGWLFYRSTPQKRALIIAVTACVSFSFMPYITVGLMIRYMFLPAIFSMFLVTLLVFEISGVVYSILEGRLKRYHLSQDLTIASLALVMLLPAIYLNYSWVKQYIQNIVYAGKLLQEVVEGTIRVVPYGLPGETRIIYINLPGRILSELPASLGTTFSSHAQSCRAALDLLYREHGIKTTTAYKIDAFLLDLGYHNVRLSPKAWYSIMDDVPWWVPKISPDEYNTLSKDENNKILFFNPVSFRLEDVSGWSYEELEGSIAPYRDKLNYDPPSFLP